MLYQGAVRFMKKAILHIEQKDMEGKGNALIRAQDIILELTYALDQESLDRGDELALNLQRLYLYSYRRLVHANVHIEVRTDSRSDRPDGESTRGLGANSEERWWRVCWRCTSVFGLVVTG